MKENLLNHEEKRRLLDVAESAIENALNGGPLHPPALAGLPPRLAQPGASFVTLTQGGRLRGCIGSLEPVRPLAEDTHRNALAAAFRDPRFPPLAAHEWPRTDVEVSVLSPPEPLPYESLDDLIRKLSPEMGLVLEHPRGRATYLPQVWQQLPDPERFLASLAQKAGLSPSVYADPATRLAFYTVEKFTRRDLA
ncbi:AMMECR1 domain protein [Oceanithermus profundus DSM 14977]|uniref:AMMECR1 domain protein n=1 Tax=Oceanithermus profundus (strain DSM 14977 / NBRC 100410 / VKM B-2274 / 506) TaxID=670487 RepID=E4U9T0_OCEP5|nr:AmmeMemoRadiSam system protein A [Oceanithermus profundus]ADR37244.1 AMMECR1 domain protein [Oceanithermus profundus DSM 14977]